MLPGAERFRSRASLRWTEADEIVALVICYGIFLHLRLESSPGRGRTKGTADGRTDHRDIAGARGRRERPRERRRVERKTMRNGCRTRQGKARSVEGGEEDPRNPRPDRDRDVLRINEEKGCDAGAGDAPEPLQMSRTAFRGKPVSSEAPVTSPFRAPPATGAVIGFVSGTTGTGGDVLLASIILAMNRVTARQATATGGLQPDEFRSDADRSPCGMGHIPGALPVWPITVVTGGSVGARVGSRYLSDRWLRGVLAVLLLASGAKLVL